MHWKVSFYLLLKGLIPNLKGAQGAPSAAGDPQSLIFTPKLHPCNQLSCLCEQKNIFFIDEQVVGGYPKLKKMNCLLRITRG